MTNDERRKVRHSSLVLRPDVKGACMSKPTVLLTGATGYIAGQLLPVFRERYDLRLTDVRRENRDGQPVEGVVVADLLDADAPMLAALVAGVDAIVHCAY